MKKGIFKFFKIVPILFAVSFAVFLCFTPVTHAQSTEADLACKMFTKQSDCKESMGCVWVSTPFSKECVGKKSNYLGREWDHFYSGMPGYNNVTDKTAEDLVIDFIKNLVRILRYVIGAVALIMGIIYAMALIFSQGKEESMTKQKQNFIFVLVGFVILIIADNVAQVFNPAVATESSVIDFEAASDQLRDVVDYIKWLIGSIIVFSMVVSSIFMITAGGEEEQITKQKRNIIYGVIGMMIMLLATNIVDIIYVIKAPGDIVAGTADSAISQVVGVVRLILAFLGPLAIAFTIYAGFSYLTALDNEERSQKAKRMIISGIVAVVMIYSSYALVNTIVASQVGLS